MVFLFSNRKASPEYRYTFKDFIYTLPYPFPATFNTVPETEYKVFLRAGRQDDKRLTAFAALS